jgi:aryl-alcohol dehydrogenase-like predicted oxidoreductase
VLATKVGLKMEGEKGGAAPSYVIEAFERSLRRLKTDYVDLYQLHEPDPTVPIADTIGAFQKLVRDGKVREIGCSNFSSEQLREAAKAAGDGPRFVSVQNQYSMLHREPEIDVLKTAAELDVAFLPFFPLASGLLTGKLRAGDAAPANSRLSEQRYVDRFVTPSNLEMVERLRAFAESRNHSILELAFGWLLAQPVVASVIAGARTPEQVLMNARSASWRLSAAELRDVDRILAAPVA